MLERREITRETLSPILKLKVRPGQEHLVAPNAVTVAQCAYEQPGGYVWGLWDGEQPVGLIAMIGWAVRRFGLIPGASAVIRGGRRAAPGETAASPPFGGPNPPSRAHTPPIHEGIMAAVCEAS